MDEIKRIQINTPQTSSEKSKDNYTMLKDKYAKFLSDMQKSETGNSVLRYEKELDFLNQLISEAEKEGDKSAVEEYEKKAQEIVDKISKMKIEILPAYTSPLLYRPAIYIEPDRNDGSREEKIYALSKFYTIGVNGEEYPLFTKKEIKEFLKDDKIYNSILNLCNVTREQEDGTFAPAFDGRLMKQLVCYEGKEISKQDVERLQELANIKHTPNTEEQYYFDSLSTMVDIVKDDKAFENAKKLLSIKNIDKKQNKEEIFLSQWSLSKYCKSDIATQKITEILSHRRDNDKESRPIIQSYELDEIINDTSKYQNAIKIAELSKNCENTDIGFLSSILERPKYTSNCIKLLELKNSNNENVLQDIYEIRRLATSEIDFDNEDIQYLLISLSEITDEEGNRIYLDKDIRYKLELTKNNSIDDILKISNLFYKNEEGKIEALFNDYETTKILKDDSYRKKRTLQNAEKLVNMTYTNKDGVEKSLISKDLILYLLFNTGVEINETSKNLFKTLISNQNTAHNATNETLISYPLITEDDIRNCPALCMDNWTDENLKILNKLLELTKDVKGLKEQVFTKNELLTPYITHHFPEKADDNFYKKIIGISELIDNTQNSTNGNIMYPTLILDVSKNNDFEIDDKFREKFKNLKDIKSDGITFLGDYDAIQCCLKNIDIAKIEKLSTFKKQAQYTIGIANDITYSFDKNSIDYLLKNDKKLDTAILLASIQSPNETNKTMSFFDGTTITDFLRKETNFKYNSQYEMNVKNILKEINANSLNTTECTSDVKAHILKSALSDTETNNLIKNLKEYNGDVNTAIKLSTDNNNFDKNTVERIIALRSYYTFSPHDQEYTRAFGPGMAKKISENDTLYENVIKFIKNSETEQDGKSIITNEIEFIAYLIENKNIKIDDEFIKNYNNLMSIEFNGEKFLRESTAVDLLNKKEIINDILSLSEFKNTYYNEINEEEKEGYTFNKYTLYSFIDDPKLIEPAKKLASLTYNTSKNEEMSFLNGYNILQILKKEPSVEISEDFITNLKSIISQVYDDNTKTSLNKHIEEIVEKCLTKTTCEDFIKTLKLFNGDLELSLEIEKRKKYLKSEDIELMAKLAKYQKYDEQKKMYKTIFDERTLENIVKNKNDYNRILQFLEKTSKSIDDRQVSKFGIETIKLLIEDKELCNTVLNVLPQKLPKSLLDKYQEKELITACKFIDYQNKENINELNLKEKRKLISLLIKSNIDLFEMKQLKVDFPLIPNSREEYCTLLPKLVKSIGIETNPISDDVKNKFLSSDLFKLSEELKNVDFDKLEITQKISTENFVEQIQCAQQKYNISDKEMKKVFDYFAFEIKNNELEGYPANLQNGKKLEEISDLNTKYFINEVVRKIVIDYTENNPITTNYNSKLDTILNDVIKVFPELHTIVSKPQHKTHSYDVLVHSLKVLNEITTNPEYTKLSDDDKQILMISSLLHDITKQKGNIDKTHPLESSFDSFFICKKLNLSKEMESKIYDLIKNHDWTEKINRAENKQKAIEDFAFEFRNTNLLKLANIFSIADLKAVKKDNEFYNKYKNDIEEITNKVSELINQLQDTQPLLPNSTFPKASEIKDGKGVYRTEDGVPIIKLNEVENLEEIGFPKGTTPRNLKFLVHGLDNNTNLANFNTFSMIDSEALLSTSYIINPYTEYHVFRPQGVILNCDTMDVHAGSNMDYGSGCKKDINTLKEQYIFSGSNRRGNDRTFFSELLKVALNTTDDEKLALNMKFKKNPRESKQIISKENESVSKEEYRALIEKYQNKSFAQIQTENPEFANELIKIFDIIENCNRSHGRRYNEVLVTRPKIQGVFMFDAQNRQINPINFLNKFNEESINQELVKFAKENDLPVVYFGD